MSLIDVFQMRRANSLHQALAGGGAYDGTPSC